MDCNKTGRLIYELRKEKGFTQNQLAEKMNISDRTISKWERGMGCPDVSLLNRLSEILGVNVDRILKGEIEGNDADGGNMKRIRFYVCPACGNILTSTGEAEISCCGRKLAPATAKCCDEEHQIKVIMVEDDFYITFPHEMSKSHYLSFFAYVGYDRILMVRLYPEQGGELRFPAMHGGRLYYYCNKHGLLQCNIK